MNQTKVWAYPRNPPIINPSKPLDKFVEPGVVLSPSASPNLLSPQGAAISVAMKDNRSGDAMLKRNLSDSLGAAHIHSQSSTSLSPAELPELNTLGMTPGVAISPLIPIIDSKMNVQGNLATAEKGNADPGQDLSPKIKSTTHYNDKENKDEKQRTLLGLASAVVNSAAISLKECTIPPLLQSTSWLFEEDCLNILPETEGQLQLYYDQSQTEEPATSLPKHPQLQATQIIVCKVCQTELSGNTCEICYTAGLGSAALKSVEIPDTQPLASIDFNLPNLGEADEDVKNLKSAVFESKKLHTVLDIGNSDAMASNSVPVLALESQMTPIDLDVDSKNACDVPIAETVTAAVVTSQPLVPISPSALNKSSFVSKENDITPDTNLEPVLPHAAIPALLVPQPQSITPPLDELVEKADVTEIAAAEKVRTIDREGDVAVEEASFTIESQIICSQFVEADDLLLSPSPVQPPTASPSTPVMAIASQIQSDVESIASMNILADDQESESFDTIASVERPRKRKRVIADDSNDECSILPREMSEIEVTRSARRTTLYKHQDSSSSSTESDNSMDEDYVQYSKDRVRSKNSRPPTSAKSNTKCQPVRWSSSPSKPMGPLSKIEKQPPNLSLPASMSGPAAITRGSAVWAPSNGFFYSGIAQGFFKSTDSFIVSLASERRVLVKSDMLKAIDLQPNDACYMILEDGNLIASRILTVVDQLKLYTLLIANEDTINVPIEQIAMDETLISINRINYIQKSAANSCKLLAGIGICLALKADGEAATGQDKWLDKAAVREQILELGGETYESLIELYDGRNLHQSSPPIVLLLANRPLRTHKYLTALALGTMIISIAWLQESIKEVLFLYIELFARS